MFGNGKRIEAMKGAMDEWVSLSEKRDRELKTEITEGFNLLAEQIKSLSENAGKHDMAIEDMLDAWEDRQRQEEEREAWAQRKEEERLNAERNEALARESAFLETICCVWDQLFNLRTAAEKSGDESWTRQLALTEDILGEKAQSAGMARTGVPGERFDYDLHEAVERVRTDKEEENMTVAAVISPGYRYGGKVLKKALVMVRRFSGEERE